MSSVSSVQSKSAVSQFLPITALRESPTNPRKYFDPKKLKELSDSVKEHGIIEPLVVRGKPADAEIICGARRYRAAKLAGLAEVPVIFKDLSDEEVRLVQLVENGQRDDLSPLEEAETYAELQATGMAVPAIAKKVSREPSQVARRLPLTTLGKRVKDSLATGAIGVEYAELIARIPDPKLHDEALAAILESEHYDGEEKPTTRPVPYAVAKRLIEEQFMAPLSVAVFDPEDAELSPLGACSKCPHLVGNNPTLFGDVRGKAVCTNPKDFRLKTENHLKRRRETGYTVLLTPKELKRAFPDGSRQLSKEFIDLENVCSDDPKLRKYDELLSKAEKLKTVFALKDGRVRRLFPSRDVRPALLAAGHAFAKDKPKAKGNGKAEEARSAAQLERIGEDAVSRELAVKLRSVKLALGGWIDLLLRIAVMERHWKLEGVLRRHGFAGSHQEFAEKRERIVKNRLEAMSEAEKRAFLVDLLIGDWQGSADKGEQELYRFVLKLAGVEYAKVANRAIDEAKRQAVEAKKTPKPPIAAKTARAGGGAKRRNA